MINIGEYLSCFSKKKAEEKWNKYCDGYWERQKEKRLEILRFHHLNNECEILRSMKDCHPEERAYVQRQMDERWLETKKYVDAQFGIAA